MSEYYIPNIYPSSTGIITINKNKIYSYTLLSEFGFLLIANKQSVNYSGIIYFNSSTCSSLTNGNNLYVVATIPATAENQGIYLAYDNNTIKIWNNTSSAQTMIINSTVVKLS